MIPTQPAQNNSAKDQIRDSILKTLDSSKGAVPFDAVTRIINRDLDESGASWDEGEILGTVTRLGKLGIIRLGTQEGTFHIGKGDYFNSELYLRRYPHGVLETKNLRPSDMRY